MTTTSTDLLNDYARQIRVVTECAHALEDKKRELIAAKQHRLLRELRSVVEDEDCVAYIIIGSNETARKDRRQLWLADHLFSEDNAVLNAEHDVAEAEIALEEARYRRTLLRLSCEANHEQE